MTDSTETTLPGMMLCARQHIARVEAVRPMARDTWAVRIHAPELAASITPGQFFITRPATKTDPLLGRPFATMPGCSAVVNALPSLREHPNQGLKAIQDWVGVF